MSDEQMAALLVVADQFNLNPFVKEIYAFPDTNGRGIVPIVPIDGWARIANEHPQYDGVKFAYADETITVHGKKCPAWIDAVIYRKDRTQPTEVREYLEECVRDTGPWKSHPRRMLRHKAFMQCCRVALSFGGVYDEDEAERIAAARLVEMENGMSAPVDVTPPKALPAPTLDEEFDAVIRCAGFAEQAESVAAYLNVCAKHFGKSVDEVKSEICRHPDDFAKAFPAWVKSVEQQKQGKKQKAAAKEEKKDDPAPASPDQPAAPAPQGQGLTHDPKTGEVIGGGQPQDAYLITCPKNDKKVDERDCAGKQCRDGCPQFFM